jgi:hypothetical protein
VTADEAARQVRARRPARAAALAATVALGLASRLAPLGAPLWDKSLGDALYAVAAYLFFGLLFPRLVAGRLAVAALAYCLAVEAFQLTGIPARYAGVPGVRWVLGTTFSWHEVWCYVAGIALVWVLETRWVMAAK